MALRTADGINLSFLSEMSETASACTLGKVEVALSAAFLSLETPSLEALLGERLCGKELTTDAESVKAMFQTLLPSVLEGTSPALVRKDVKQLCLRIRRRAAKTRACSIDAGCTDTPARECVPVLAARRAGLLARAIRRCDSGDGDASLKGAVADEWILEPRGDISAEELEGRTTEFLGLMGQARAHGKLTWKCVLSPVAPDGFLVADGLARSVFAAWDRRLESLGFNFSNEVSK